MKRPRNVSVSLTIAEKRPLVIVNGETADVETARGDIVTSAALSHIHHSRRDVGDLKYI